MSVSLHVIDRVTRPTNVEGTRSCEGREEEGCEVGGIDAFSSPSSGRDVRGLNERIRSTSCEAPACRDSE